MTKPKSSMSDLTSTNFNDFEMKIIQLLSNSKLIMTSLWNPQRRKAQKIL